MIIDKQGELSLQQAITNTAVSTNEKKIGANAGAGEPIRFLFTVDEAFGATGAATLTVSLQAATAAGGSYADVITTAAIPKTTLVKEYQFTLQLPDTHAAFVRANYTVGTGPMTAGKITCQQIMDNQTNRN